MSQAAKAPEPSMEEILASIRRIISDDDAGKTPPPPPPAAKAAPPPPPPPAPAPPPRAEAPRPAPAPKVEDFERPLAARAPEPPAPDILDLTESMAAAEPPPNFRTIDAQADVIFTDVAPEEPPAPELRMPEPPPMERPLLSSSATAAVDSAFSTLAHTVLVQNGRTLEDLVREMLRPMLKAWLDDNLPGLVERLVRAEIERVSRGRP